LAVPGWAVAGFAQQAPSPVQHEGAAAVVPPAAFAGCPGIALIEVLPSAGLAMAQESEPQQAQHPAGLSSPAATIVVVAAWFEAPAAGFAFPQESEPQHAQQPPVSPVFAVAMPGMLAIAPAGLSAAFLPHESPLQHPPLAQASAPQQPFFSAAGGVVGAFGSCALTEPNMNTPKEMTSVIAVAMLAK
jgi:hypothetical protein